MPTALLYAFIAVILVQSIYYIGVFGVFAFGKTGSKTTSANNIPLSVVIWVKNREESLKKNLPKILQQDYPCFQIVLINDASYDNTLEVMETFAFQHSNIKIVNVENNEAFWGKKKYALTLGIKATKHDHLVFTEIDCEPASNKWLQEIAANFSEEKTIVLGYGNYKKVKNSILNALIRFDNLFTSLQYFSFAKIGMPYTGTGRNLAFHKNDFFKVNGFMNHMHLRVGEDNLFVNETASATNTAICYSEDSFTFSTTYKTLKEWFLQKRNNHSTMKYYKPSHKGFLGLFSISQALFWLLAPTLLILNEQFWIVISLIAFRFIMAYTVIGFSAKKLKAASLILFFPFWELFLICFQFIIFIVNSFSRSFHWK